jgi:hypothetical protein
LLAAFPNCTSRLLEHLSMGVCSVRCFPPSGRSLFISASASETREFRSPLKSCTRRRLRACPTASRMKHVLLVDASTLTGTATREKTIFRIKVYAVCTSTPRRHTGTSPGLRAALPLPSTVTRRSFSACSLYVFPMTMRLTRDVCRALFDVYLGDKPISIERRQSLIRGFPALLGGSM